MDVAVFQENFPVTWMGRDIFFSPWEDDPGAAIAIFSQITGGVSHGEREGR